MSDEINNGADNTASKNTFWERVNAVYVASLVLAGLLWCAQLHTFGLSVGLAAIAIAFFIYRRQRLAYFAAAVWCFGLLRISMDDGHDFHQGYQSLFRGLYFIALIIPIILHEKVAKKAAKPSEGHEL